MQRSLEADGEKLRQLTGEDHGPHREPDWLFVGCEKGHDWKCLGGRNAGCDEYCCCSVPVHSCTRCGLCDYGENEEAAEILEACIAATSA